MQLLRGCRRYLKMIVSWRLEAVLRVISSSSYGSKGIRIVSSVVWLYAHNLQRPIDSDKKTVVPYYYIPNYVDNTYCTSIFYRMTAHTISAPYPTNGLVEFRFSSAQTSPQAPANSITLRGSSSLIARHRSSSALTSTVVVEICWPYKIA
jgi:hypothetical protein